MSTVASKVMKVWQPGGLRVAAWLRGVLELGFDAASPGADVEIVSLPPREGSTRSMFAMVMPLEPVLRKFVSAGVVVEQVQTFRHVGTDGTIRDLLWCAACGHTMTVDLMDLQRLGQLQCRRCTAVPSRTVCDRWHSFGCCPSCQEFGAVS